MCVDETCGTGVDWSLTIQKLWYIWIAACSSCVIRPILYCILRMDVSDSLNIALSTLIQWLKQAHFFCALSLSTSAWLLKQSSPNVRLTRFKTEFVSSILPAFCQVAFIWSVPSPSGKCSVPSIWKQGLPLEAPTTRYSSLDYSLVVLKLYWMEVFVFGTSLCLMIFNIHE